LGPQMPSVWAERRFAAAVGRRPAGNRPPRAGARADFSKTLSSSGFGRSARSASRWARFGSRLLRQLLTSKHCRFRIFSRSHYVSRVSRGVSNRPFAGETDNDAA
ncbi:hypothetical protein, partial [Mycobacterium talmoniae]|uniref:hypothetical protein n=1 Tax=Mycobacterium talmoniae TaxID=1858794 RepID=UPI001A9696BA